MPSHEDVVSTDERWCVPVSGIPLAPEHLYVFAGAPLVNRTKVPDEAPRR